MDRNPERIALSNGVRGDRYTLLPAEREAFLRNGHVSLPGLLDEAELAALELDYERFLSREIAVPGRDFCDMAGAYDLPVERFAIVNVMLPRKHHPAWVGNVLERRAASLAEQLCGPDMQLDYDQLLAKQPFRDDAVFGWHQDLAYWPPSADPRTATVWLAIDDATPENGCLRFVPGSHKEPELRPHHPLVDDRGRSHALVTELNADDSVLLSPLRRGDVSVHCERVLHGSGGNRTAGRRRAYIVAFRSAATVAEERRQGFTHSHEDSRNVLDDTGIAGQSRKDGLTPGPGSRPS